MASKKAENKGDFLQELLEWLASLRLTVFTLIFLGLAVLLGTVIPQIDITMPRQAAAERMSDPVWGLMTRVGLLDVFHSVWFLFLVALLMVNLTACTLRTIGRVRRLLAATSEVLDRDTETKAGFVTRVAAGPAGVAAIEKRFGEIGEVRRTERDGAVHLFAQNSWLPRFGVVVVHCSLLFVLAGALARALVGVEGQIALPEGGSANVFVTKNDELIRLPFDLRCEKFTMEMYPGTQRPKDYRSTLSLWRDGKKIDEQTVHVNHPLSAGAFRFFQASYGKDEFPVLRLTGPGLTAELPVVAQQVQSVPGRRDGFIVDEARREAAGLEIHVTLTAGDDKHEAWLAEKGPAATFGPYTVAFVGLRQGFYTGVMVTADPGVRLLYAGFGIFFVGLFLALYTSHRRVWARIVGGEATLAVSASRNREAAKDWLEKTAAAAKG